MAALKFIEIKSGRELEPSGIGFSEHGLNILNKIKNTLDGRDYCCARVSFCLDHIIRYLPKIANGKYDYAYAECDGNDTVEIKLTASPCDINNTKMAPEPNWDRYESYEADYIFNFNKKGKQEED